jgi:hypothetical protein
MWHPGASFIEQTERNEPSGARWMRDVDKREFERPILRESESRSGNFAPRSRPIFQKEMKIFEKSSEVSRRMGQASW